MPHSDPDFPRDNSLAMDAARKAHRRERQREAEEQGTDITPLGQLGDVEFGQIDPRTDFMRMLEMASAPLLFGSLLNPSGIPGMLGAQPLGQGGGGPGTGLLGLLLGGGAMQGAGGGGQVPGAEVVGGQNPIENLLGGAFGDSLFGGESAVKGGNVDPGDSSGGGGGSGGSDPDGGGRGRRLLAGGGEAGTAQASNNSVPVNFLQTGGQLQPDALNIVGEQGPEAVVGDQVVPLDPASQSEDRIVQSGPGTLIKPGRTADDPQGTSAEARLLGAQEQFDDIGQSQLQALEALAQQGLVSGVSPQGLAEMRHQQGLASRERGAKFAEVFGKFGLIPESSVAKAGTAGNQQASADNGLNMDAVNAITGVEPSQPAGGGIPPARPRGGDPETREEFERRSRPMEGSEARRRMNDRGLLTTPEFGSGDRFENFIGLPGLTGGGGDGGTGGNGGGGGTPGGTFPQSPNQGAGTGMIQRLLEQNPELQAFGTAQDILTGEGGLLNRAPGAGVIGAMEPVFQRNLEFGLGQLRNQAPSTFNSGLALQGTDLSRQALQDFNVTAQQAAQQGVQNQLSGLSTLGSLAQPAGQNPFQRALSAGQFGLAAQDQAFQQQVGPTMQLLAQALAAATPTGMQTVGGPFTEGK